jgi:hypothetical protein
VRACAWVRVRVSREAGGRDGNEGDRGEIQTDRRMYGRMERKKEGRKEGRKEGKANGLTGNQRRVERLWRLRIRGGMKKWLHDHVDFKRIPRQRRMHGSAW